MEKIKKQCTIIIKFNDNKLKNYGIPFQQKLTIYPKWISRRWQKTDSFFETDTTKKIEIRRR
jgi:hypothetical protein